MGSNQVHLPGNRSKPIILSQSATFDDRSHVAEREDPSAVVRHDNLLACHGISPLLVAAGISRHFESAAAQDGDDVVGRKARSPAHPTITSMSLASCGRSMSE